MSMTLTPKLLRYWVNAGYTAKEMAKFAGVSKNTVYFKCDEYGVKLPKGLPVGFKKERK